MKEKHFLNLFRYGLALFLITIPLILYFLKFGKYGLSDSQAKWAEFGDYISGCFGVLAFGGVLYTIYIQFQQKKIQEEQTSLMRQDVLNNLEELKESRMEWRKAAEAQEKSQEFLAKQAVLQEKQLEVQKQQIELQEKQLEMQSNEIEGQIKQLKVHNLGATISAITIKAEHVYNDISNRQNRVVNKGSLQELSNKYQSYSRILDGIIQELMDLNNKSNADTEN